MTKQKISSNIEHEISWLEEDADESIKEINHSLPHRDMHHVLDMDEGHLADVLKLVPVLWATGYLGNITPDELENKYSNFCKERFSKDWVTFEYQNTQHLCDDTINVFYKIFVSYLARIFFYFSVQKKRENK